MILSIKKIISSHHESFPLSGIVSKSGNYYYLNINDEKNYVRSASMILSVSEPDITISPPVGFKKTVIVPPPSPIGTHVTLRNNLPYNELGKERSEEHT